MATGRLKKKIGKGRHLSQLKRARQGEKRRARNKGARTELKSAIKVVRATGSKESLARAVPLLARNAGKGLIHYKKARRLISRLTRAANAAAK